MEPFKDRSSISVSGLLLTKCGVLILCVWVCVCVCYAFKTGQEVFITMASLGSQFPLHFGKLLALAQTTFLAVLPPATLLAINLFLHPELASSGSAVFSGFVQEALKAVGITRFAVSIVEQPHHKKSGHDDEIAMRILRVDIYEGKHDVTVDCNGRSMSMKVAQDGTTSLNAIGTAYPPINLYRAGRYASLEFQMALGISDGSFRIPHPHPPLTQRVHPLEIDAHMYPVHMVLRLYANSRFVRDSVMVRVCTCTTTEGSGQYLRANGWRSLYDLSGWIFYLC